MFHSSHPGRQGWRSAARLAVVALLFLAARGAVLAPVADAAPKADRSPRRPAAVQWIAPAAGVFGPRSVWRTPVTRAPLNARSAAMVGQLTHQVAEYYGGTAAFNVWQYNVSFVSVPATQPRVTVAWSNCQHKTYLPAGLTGPGGVLTAIPIPGTATSAVGKDGELTVYSRATDQLWELYQATKTPDGQWSACWGGRIDHVSSSPGWFDGGFGASASGLAAAGGMVSIADLRRGSINHALSLAIPSPATWHDVSWPAQRSDGSSGSTSNIPEGTRFRLSPGVDLAALHLTPIALMIARAAQRYGFIVTDKSGTVAVSAESGSGLQASTGVNPWNRALGAIPSFMQLANFPWASLQALPGNWGEPT